MVTFEDIKYGRKAAVITALLSRKSDDELNNLLYDLRVRYNVNDEDFMRWNVCISLITTRKDIERFGRLNDDTLGGDSNVGSV